MMLSGCFNELILSLTHSGNVVAVYKRQTQDMGVLLVLGSGFFSLDPHILCLRQGTEINFLTKCLTLALKKCQKEAPLRGFELPLGRPGYTS